MNVSEESTQNIKNMPDQFDLNALRLSQNFSESIGVKKALLTVPVRKPGKQDFIRVRPGEEWHLETVILELKEERQSYLVAPELWNELPGEIVPKVLFTAIDRQGVLFIWPIRLPGPDGRQDHWNRSALDAASLAMKQWVRVSANMNLGAYEVFTASAAIKDPDWPDISFSEILKIAFRDLYITDLDHPVVRRLQGLQ